MPSVQESIRSLEEIARFPSLTVDDRAASCIEAVAVVSEHVREGLLDRSHVESPPHILHAARLLCSYLASLQAVHHHSIVSDDDVEREASNDGTTPLDHRQSHGGAARELLEAAFPLILGPSGADCLRALTKDRAPHSAEGPLAVWLDVQVALATACGALSPWGPEGPNAILLHADNIKVRSSAASSIWSSPTVTLVSLQPAH